MAGLDITNAGGNGIEALNVANLDINCNTIAAPGFNPIEVTYTESVGQNVNIYDNIITSGAVGVDVMMQNSGADFGTLANLNIYDNDITADLGIHVDMATGNNTSTRIDDGFIRGNTINAGASFGYLATPTETASLTLSDFSDNEITSILPRAFYTRLQNGSQATYTNISDNIFTTNAAASNSGQQTFEIRGEDTATATVGALDSNVFNGGAISTGGPSRFDSTVFFYQVDPTTTITVNGTVNNTVNKNPTTNFSLRTIGTIGGSITINGTPGMVSIP